MQGDIVAITNANGNIVVEYTYDSWGKLISISGSHAGSVGSVNHFLYRGYYYDYETSLYYLNSRYYDPCTKRFVNADEYASTGMELNANNTFTYCLNDPINHMDSLGTHPAELYPEYDTMDEAAIEAAEYIGKYSFTEFKGDFSGFYEYSICIYKVERGGEDYYYFDPDTLWTDYDNLYNKNPYFEKDIDGMFSSVALVHTHPYNYIPNDVPADGVSEWDKYSANRMGKTIYAYTYTGKVEKYTPGIGVKPLEVKLDPHRHYAILSNILKATGDRYLK